MRSACFPLNIQGGCCHSREPTVWSQLIAGSVSTRRKSRIDHGRKRCPQIPHSHLAGILSLATKAKRPLNESGLEVGYMKLVARHATTDTDIR
jgi:hypothetical protein